MTTRLWLAVALLSLASALWAQDMVLVDVPQGWVGCGPQDASCMADEKPGGWVKLKPFWMDTHEVTVGAYRAFVAATGWPFPPQPAGSGEKSPVVNVTHRDAAAFCAWLGKRLPSEAEWEVAARGSYPQAIYPSGGSADHDSANFAGLGGKDRFSGLAPVGSFPPNTLGLFDMAGNVWEWVADGYTPAPPQGQAPASSGKLKVTKGGGWNSPPLSLRISNRGRLPEDTASDAVGFRCARDAQAEELTIKTPAPPQPAAAAPTPATAAVPTPATEVRHAPSPTSSQAQTPPPTPTPATLQEKTLTQVPLTVVQLPGGSFERGCVKGDSWCSADEQPRRAIVLSPFWIGKTEVTVAQFRAFAEATGSAMPEQPSWSGDDYPVVNVTWDEAQAFCRWLSGRLPTEAEWEYAARGGTSGTRYPRGSEITRDEANYDGVGGRDQFAKAAPVGSFPANGFGLYDMLGNVWEWCLDWYQEDYYAQSPDRDPQGPEQGQKKVVRGGSFTSDPGRLRLSYRSSLKPSERWLFTGFRCVIPERP